MNLLHEQIQREVWVFLFTKYKKVKRAKWIHKDNYNPGFEKWILQRTLYFWYVRYLSYSHFFASQDNIRRAMTGLFCKWNLSKKWLNKACLKYVQMKFIVGFLIDVEITVVIYFCNLDLQVYKSDVFTVLEVEREMERDLWETTIKW